jgi:hypothetical protein
MKAHLGEKKLDELQKIAMKKLVGEDQNMVMCTCGNIIELVQGKVDYG